MASRIISGINLSCDWTTKIVVVHQQKRSAIGFVVIPKLSVNRKSFSDASSWVKDNGALAEFAAVKDLNKAAPPDPNGVRTILAVNETGDWLAKGLVAAVFMESLQDGFVVCPISVSANHKAVEIDPMARFSGYKVVWIPFPMFHLFIKIDTKIRIHYPIITWFTYDNTFKES